MGCGGSKKIKVHPDPNYIPAPLPPHTMLLVDAIEVRFQMLKDQREDLLTVTMKLKDIEWALVWQTMKALEFEVQRADLFTVTMKVGEIKEPNYTQSFIPHMMLLVDAEYNGRI